MDHVQAPFHYPVAAGELYDFSQLPDANGKERPKITLRVVGDAKYPLFETVDGFTVRMNEAGEYCYAELTNDGKLIAGIVPASQPPPRGLPPALRESPELVQQRLKLLRDDMSDDEKAIDDVFIDYGDSADNTAHDGIVEDDDDDDGAADCDEDNAANVGENVQDDVHAVRTPPDVMPSAPSYTFGPNKGLLHGDTACNGAVHGLTVLVQFSDVKIHDSIKASMVHDMYNGDNFVLNGNVSSVKKYFHTVSNGDLTFTNQIAGPYTLKHRQSYYIKHNMMTEVLQKIVQDDSVDLEKFNYNRRNIVSALNVLYAGNSIYTGALWPHNHFVQGGPKKNGIGFFFYLLTGLGRRASDLRIGTICHENGHLLCRWPDLYDYGVRDGDDVKSQGMGKFCLMGSGSHLDDGLSPAVPNAHYRQLVQWSSNKILTPRDRELRLPVADYAFTYRFTIDENESFVLENRTRQGLDRALPASGLALYHCDLLGSNEFQQGTVDKHYQVALIQADGRRDLENNRNRGDAGDLFRPGQAAGDGVNHPNTRCWNSQSSGLHVEVQRFESDQTIVVSLHNPPPNVALKTIKLQDAPNLVIPDNYSAGVSTWLAADNVTGFIRRIEISADIRHTYRGDLHVTLRHGGNGTVVASPSFNDARANIKLNSLDVTSHFQDVQVAGPWTLNIVDRQRRDIGRLLSWQLNIQYEEI
mmetsp:Transcript_22876/g.38885  ORF Transcript_22876/g.38885 Transcript_22876/m.38885 type:complete len:697 (-) Transcript_22876:101-2191(-)